MPELPEVETTRRGIEPHVVGRVVTRVLVREPRLRWPVTSNLGPALTGQRFERVARRAKYLLLETGAGTLMLHLGMSGSLRVLPADVEPGQHDHVDLDLDDGRVLRFRDPRRFGSMFWVAGGEHHALLSDLGPEPLDDAFCAEYLFAISRGRSVAVKNFIMNSRVVAGVGNIYANEALHQARIRPDRAAGRISRARYRSLVAAIKQVLASAIEAGGTTLRDFVREDGSPGYFRHELKVYGRGGEPCPSCGKPLRDVRLGQRSTVFCGNCQR